MNPFPLCKYALKDLSGDVRLFADPLAGTPLCTWQPWHESRPTRRNRWVMYNCYRWKLIWLN